MYIEIYLSLLFIPAIAGALIGIFSNRFIKAVSTILCCVSCAAGVGAFLMYLAYGDISYTLPITSAWGSYSILIDELTALVISFSSGVFLLIIMHMFRSESAPAYPRYFALVSLLFASCTLAMCADEVLLLLISWELVTLTSFLMAYTGKDEGARWKFFVITHLGGLMIISAFLIMFVFAGTDVLSQWDGLSAVMGAGTSCVVIALLFFGFGTKLGLVPFHAWMPDLYAEAPTHTTAFLSTVSSNVAVLILFKSVFGYIGVTEDMFVLSIILMLLASVTAIWGALESLIQTQPKRILAYSSMENMALVLLCFSLAMLFMSDGPSVLATIALVAGLFHTINHSVFKALMIMTVGTVEDITGETAIERMGGLAKALPFFSMFALVAVLSMAAIPPFNGFASEWLMIQSMLGGEFLGMSGMDLILPLGVAILGISGMMAAVSYARMYGFMFLGRPRSDAVAKPKRIRRLTFAPMGFLALLCILLGLCAVPMMTTLADGIAGATGLPTTGAHSDVLNTLNIPLIAAALALTVAVLYGLNLILKKKTATSATWDCGTNLEENMQYSSIGFTQPLVRVFHPIYGDSVEIVDDEKANKKKFSVRFKEPFVTYLYEPIGKAVMAVSKFIGKMQNGSVQTYLGYILVVLVALLLVVGYL